MPAGWMDASWVDVGRIGCSIICPISTHQRDTLHLSYPLTDGSFLVYENNLTLSVLLVGKLKYTTTGRPMATVVLRGWNSSVVSLLWLNRVFSVEGHTKGMFNLPLLHTSPTQCISQFSYPSAGCLPCLFPTHSGPPQLITQCLSNT
jgi:hypothetical protein